MQKKTRGLHSRKDVNFFYQCSTGIDLKIQIKKLIYYPIFNNRKCFTTLEIAGKVLILSQKYKSNIFHLYLIFEYLQNHQIFVFFEY